MNSPFEYLIKDTDGPGFAPPVDRMPKYDPPKLTTREDIFASAATAKLLGELGDDVEPDELDKEKAREIFKSGREPTTAERKIPGTMLQLEAMLTQYDYDIIEDAERLRRFITNKLLEETTHPDAKVRLRAYKMLGDITEVGLFTERVEQKVIHAATPELVEALRAKIGRFIEGRVVSKQIGGNSGD